MLIRIDEAGSLCEGDISRLLAKSIGVNQPRCKGEKLKICSVRHQKCGTGVVRDRK